MPTGPGPAGGDGEPWRELFGFEEPYENQADAIRAAIEVGRDGGFLAMEGPCGTGKTMAALTAAAFLVRETDRYENVVAITPVKQQLRQFVDDLRAMNAGLEAPLDGLALVGKADLCPYGREGVFPGDAGVHERCEDLREHTADLVEADNGGGSGRGRDEAWWDPERAGELARAARRDTGEARSRVEERLITAGAESPYVRRQPSAPEGMAGAGDPPLYCPFEADWYARNKGSPVGFADGEGRVLTSEEFLPGAVEHGTCPHRAMGTLLEEADVVVGNYNHLFDPRTRELTDAVLDEGTFVIVDEAHRLEGRVRDLLSDRIGRRSLRQAGNDLDRLLRYARQGADSREGVAARLAEYDVPLGAVERARDFYADLVEWLDGRIDDHLAAEVDGYGGAFGGADLPEEDLEIPLRDPEGAGPDELTEWAADAGYRELPRRLGAIGAAVEGAMDEIEPDRTLVTAAVGTLLDRWWGRDHTGYFREIALEHSPTDRGDVSYPWERAYTPGLVMYNCMPAEGLRAVLDGLGGGILMSATLEPLDVFEATVGLDDLADPDDGGAGRPVAERTYGLPFPEANRASWIVDATPFTLRNRGDPAPDNHNETREEYAYVLRTVAGSPGNVLIAMPSYREAAWAAGRLREAVDKPVLLDEPSSKAETDALREEFFAGGGKVLATSTRGTLTEGIDYDGDKLGTCAVVGVPLVNVGSPRVRAVRHAYADAFGEGKAFEYALTVPAVRRARQAIGRVIRGPDEHGVRILVDRRYTAEAHRNSVHEHLPAGERDEFVRMTPTFLGSQIEEFWAGQ